MARKHIEFVEAFDVEASEVTAGALAQACMRLLSADDDAGDSTSLVSFRAGWSGGVGGSHRPVELFCLRGAFQVDGVTLRQGCYTYVPAQAPPRTSRASEDSDVLVMVEPETDTEEDAGSPLEVRDITKMQWDAVRDHLGDREGRAEGIVLKILRIDPASGAWTWVSAIPPEWRAGYAEVHPTIEECLLLRGDCFIGTSGAMQAGSYFYRPGMIPHGPMYSHTGALWFFRTKGGGLSTQYVDVPGWERLVDAYIDSKEFFAPAEFGDPSRAQLG